MYIHTKLVHTQINLQKSIDFAPILCYNIDKEKDRGQQPRETKGKVIIMMNKIAMKIDELLTRRQALIDEAAKDMDTLQIMLGEYPEETTTEIEAINTEIDAIESAYPFRARYWDVVDYEIGRYATAEEAVKAAAEYTDYITEIKNTVTGEVIK